MNVARMLGYGAKITVAMVVVVFLAVQSLNFFAFIFPPEQVVYSYLGLGLTGGGLIAYLMILKWTADTDLRKAVALVMLVVCLVGELAVAGFGMQVEAWEARGLALTAQDLTNMIWIVRVLALAHAVALILDFVGDEIISALGFSLPVSSFFAKVGNKSFTGPRDQEE